jgi:predicted permease
MATIAARLRQAYPDANRDKGIEVEPLTGHVLGVRTARSLWLLLGAVGFVLLIACANVANLALARGAERRPEYLLRMALGASRLRLIGQSLTESAVLAVLAGGTGVLMAWLAAAALRVWASNALPRLETMRLDPIVILFAIAVSLVGVAAILLPALRLSLLNTADAAGESGSRATGGRGVRRLRDALVVAEIALAVVLLAGAGLLLRSFVRLQGVDRGFDSAHVLRLQVDLPRKYDGQAGKAVYFRDAFQRIRALPNVLAAGAIDDLFITRHGDLRVVVEGPPPAGAAAPRLIRDRVVPGYFEAMGIPLLRGRFLQDSDLVADLDRDHPRAVVINEAMARQFWPGADPIGRRITYGANPGPDAQWSRVVGVVADMRRERLDEPAFPAIFFPGFGPQMDVVVRTTGDPAAMRDAIRSALLAVDPAVPPYGVTGAEQRLGQTVAVRTLQTLLIAALAAAALVLAVVGIYGLIHQSVVARTREIGVRMALGATRTWVMRMILGGAFGLASAGLALGLAGAVALSRTSAAFLYETSPLDPLTFLAVAAVIIIISIAASAVPARRAATIDPVTALRVD